MFTGIIRHVGTVRGVGHMACGARLTIDLGPLAVGLALGDSVAISGACLTASEIDGSLVVFDVVPETLSCTTLGKLRPSARVNLERAVRADQALDGHIVQGHVDGLAMVRTIRRGGEHVIEFECASQLSEQMAAKGSIAIDGVSLTLASTQSGGFSVAVIPTTLAQTTLGDLRIGANVNIETDIIGKYVLKFLRQMGGAAPSRLTIEKLRDAGFA